MPKINLLCLIGQLGNGGTEKQLYLFLKYLDKEKYHPVVVVSGAEGGIWQERIENDLNIKIHFLGNIPAIIKLLKFNWLLFKIKPEIIFSWSFYTNAFNIASSNNTKFIGSLRQQLEASKVSLSKYHYNKCISLSKIIVNSSLIAEELKNAEVNSNKISIIHNIYEKYKENKSTNNKNELRKNLDIPQNAKVIVGVGRDSHTKDFPFFIDVIEELLKFDNSIHALIIGSGGTAKKEEISKRGLNSHFSLPGEVPDARKLLPAGDVFFLSSKFEGMPNVLLEAIDAGCVPVATDVGGVRDVLGIIEDGDPGQAGLIVKNGDIKMASEKILSIIRDIEFREKIVKNAQKQLDKFSPENIIAKFHQLMDDIK